ncbi:MAG: hypothetical protein HFF14_06595 [Angelakisella sp.]|jgi:hypothetical protein|nr:hypothetical protein [Angelakisella sp.]
MPIHSILPPEAYLEAGPPVQRVQKRCRYGVVDCLPLPDGRLQICRVISTDPAAFLDPAVAPGEIFQG